MITKVLVSVAIALGVGLGVAAPAMADPTTETNSPTPSPGPAPFSGIQESAPNVRPGVPDQVQMTQGIRQGLSDLQGIQGP